MCNQSNSENNSPIENSPRNSNFEFDLFKLEYEQLAESYRHTYQTIWQAGSVFTAISAVLLVFGSSANKAAGDIYCLIKLIWPLPFFFWWLGVFTPMDRYGKIRLQRLKELEKLTKQHSEKWGHALEHFSNVDIKIVQKQKLITCPSLKVGFMVDIFAILVILIWLGYLII